MRKSIVIALVVWLIIGLVIGGVVFALSVNYFPQWKTSAGNLLALAGLIIVALLNLIGPIGTWIYLDKQERDRKDRSQTAFERETDNSMRRLKPPLRGIPNLIEREETGDIRNQLEQFTPVLLTGDAGSGKSGIAVAVADNHRNHGTQVLLIDARQLGSVNNQAAFRSYFELSEPLYDAIEWQGKEGGVLIILDQVDTMVSAANIDLMINLLIDCSTFDGVQVLAISRRREALEQRTLRPLLDTGFQEIVCRPLKLEIVAEVLGNMGMGAPPQELLKVGSNPLNLEIICEILAAAGPQSLLDFESEIALWERYREIIRDREDRTPGLTGDEFIAEAIGLATLGLNSPDRSFQIQYPPTPAQARLVSSGIIVQESGRTYRFHHEKLQDYLYAWDAASRRLSSDEVYEEIGELLARNVLH